MTHRWWPKAKGLVSMGAASGAPTFALLLLLALAVACGAAATPTPQPVATKAAPAAQPPAAAPMPTKVPAVAPQATAVPTAAPQPTPAPQVAVPVGKRGGIVPMHNAGAVAHWSVWECASGGTCMTPVTPLYNGLVQYDGNTDDPTDIKGDLATSWQLSRDGLTYVFNLAENAKWWDGVPVTSGDVVFSLNEMVRTDKPRPRAGQIRSYYESSRAIDDRTVEVKLQFPAASFLPFLATEFMKIYPKHQFGAGADLRKLENVLGSGPFKLVEYKKDISIEYKRNPDYFKKGLPYFDGMKFFVINDIGTAIAAYRSQQVLMTTFVNSNLNVREGLELAKVMEGKGRVFYPGPLGWAALLINTKVEPFTDVRVRRALHLALHRQVFMETFGVGLYPIGGPFPPDQWFSLTSQELAQLPGLRQTPDGKKHPDDIAEAKRLLAEAGHPNGFKTTILAANFLGFPDQAQVAADQLRRFVNIDATVQPVEGTAAYARYESGDWKLGFHAEGFLILDPDAVIQGSYLKGGSRNYSQWEPLRIRALFEQQSRETDREKRRKLVLEMGDILMNQDSHLAITHWTRTVWYVDNRIQNFRLPSTFPMHNMKEELWCDPKC